MSQPPPPPQPVQYSTTYHQPTSPDLSHLKTLAICHWVWGGLTILGSSVFIIHIVMGIMMLSGAFGGKGSQAPPEIIGWAFIGIGSCLVIGGWALGIATICSGFYLNKQKKKFFSMVVAGINCALMPIGTVLGIFTFLVLSKPTMKEIYNQT